MSKNKFAAACSALVALVAAANVPAVTLEEFSQKNRELLSLKADMEIIKKKQEIIKEKEGKGPATVSPMMPGMQGGSMPSGPSFEREPPMRMTERMPERMPERTPDADDLKVKSVSGDVHNPMVEFTHQGTDIPAVSRGGMVVGQWRLASAHGRTVVIERTGKAGKGGKAGAVERKTLYLPTAASSAGMSRYDSVDNQPSAGGMSPMMSMQPMPLPPFGDSRR